MEKKKRDVSLPKRFNSEDVKKWQEQANFKLNSNQWQKILEHWELKESILNIKTV